MKHPLLIHHWPIALIVRPHRFAPCMSNQIRQKVFDRVYVWVLVTLREHRCLGGTQFQGLQLCLEGFGRLIGLRFSSYSSTQLCMESAMSSGLG